MNGKTIKRNTGEFRIAPPRETRWYSWLTDMVAGFLHGVGARAIFLRDTFRGLRDPRTFVPLTIQQMRVIGVDSLPLTIIMSLFIGSVTALQTRYQLFAGVDLSVVGLISRQMIVLELGPLLTGLVLAGRVGARMTAEIGTMRVTEQIDALETLSYDPLSYLVVPRLLAATFMLPVLVIIANSVMITSAYFVAGFATDITLAQFTQGLQLSYSHFQVYYSLIKAVMFGAAIGFLCSYEGYTAEVGAEGVGRSTAQAVVVTSVAILVLDALTASLLAPMLQT